MSLDIDLERVRRQRIRPTPPKPTRPGLPATLGYVSSDAAHISKEHFFNWHPAEILGDEVEGGPYTITYDPRITRQAVQLGSGVYATGDNAILRFADYRWVATKGGCPPDSGVIRVLVQECPVRSYVGGALGLPILVVNYRPSYLAVVDLKKWDGTVLASDTTEVGVGGVTPLGGGSFPGPFSSPPTITFGPANPGDPGGGATATAILNGSGYISAITITDPGSGYDPTKPPRPMIVGSGWSFYAQANLIGYADFAVPSPGNYKVGVSKWRFAPVADQGVSTTCGGTNLSFSLTPATGYACCTPFTYPVATTVHVSVGAGSFTCGPSVDYLNNFLGWGVGYVRYNGYCVSYGFSCTGGGQTFVKTDDETCNQSHFGGCGGLTSPQSFPTLYGVGALYSSVTPPSPETGGFSASGSWPGTHDLCGPGDPNPSDDVPDTGGFSVSE